MSTMYKQTRGKTSIAIGPMRRRNETRSRLHNRADDENATRSVRDMLMFWSVCTDRRCKRARACVGDLTPGGMRCCSGLDGEQKAWLAAAGATFRANGSWPEALCAAERVKEDYCRDEEIRELMQLMAAQLRAQLEKLAARFGVRVCAPPAAVAPGQIPMRAFGRHARHKV